MKANKLLMILGSLACVICLSAVIYVNLPKKDIQNIDNSMSTENSINDNKVIDSSVGGSSATSSDSASGDTSGNIPKLDNSDYVGTENTTEALDIVNSNAVDIEKLYKSKVSDIDSASTNLLPVLRVINDGYMILDRDRKFYGESYVTYSSMLGIVDKLMTIKDIDNEDKMITINNKLNDLGVTTPSNSIVYNKQEYMSNMVEKINIRHAKKKDSDGLYSYEPIDGVDIWMKAEQGAEHSLRGNSSSLQFYINDKYNFNSNIEVFSCYLSKGYVMQILQYLDMNRLGMLENNKEKIAYENSKLINNYISKTELVRIEDYTNRHRYIFDSLSFSNYPSYEYCKARGIVSETPIEELDSLVSKEELAVMLNSYLDADLDCSVSKMLISGDLVEMLSLTSEEGDINDNLAVGTIDTPDNITEDSAGVVDTGVLVTDINIDSGGN